jgi:chromosome partitioning protein
LVISHYIVIPARPDYLSTLGIDHLQRSVGKFSAAMNHILVKNTVKGLKEVKPQVAGVVFSMVNTLNSEPIAAQNLFINNTRRLGIPVFNTFIRENNSFFASVTQNLVPIVLAKATHPAHSEVVREIVALTDEIVAETNRLAK